MDKLFQKELKKGNFSQIQIIKELPIGILGTSKRSVSTLPDEGKRFIQAFETKACTSLLEKSFKCSQFSQALSLPQTIYNSDIPTGCYNSSLKLGWRNIR